MLDPVPTGSIYLWMYRQGLKHRDVGELLNTLAASGVSVREKDLKNYWNGYYRSELYGDNRTSLWSLSVPKETPGRDAKVRLGEFPWHPYQDNPEISKRYVPCNRDNKPMIKWGQGCMDKADAEAMLGQVYLAENLKGTRLMVVDVDGDHDQENLDMESMVFFDKWRSLTHCLAKPGSYHDGIPASYHLTFTVDRIIPTMHFPWCHIDIVGNKENSLRYFKNKQWNGLEPMRMDDATWDEMFAYIRGRKERDESVGRC